MSDTMPSFSSGWVHQHYEQANINIHGVQPTSDTTNMVGSSDTIYPISSSITPSSSGGVSKPIRRRSRASKKTPTTLLSASTANFRALVQQFTGCQPTTGGAISFGSQKGPITLNFGLGSSVQNHTSSYSTAEFTAPLDNSIYYRTQSHHQMQQPRQQNVKQVLHQLQDRGYNNDDDLLLSYGYNNFSASSTTSDMPAGADEYGLFNMDDDGAALQDLAKESFSDENIYGQY